MKDLRATELGRVYGEWEVDELGSKRQGIGDRPRKEARGRRGKDSGYTRQSSMPYSSRQVLCSVWPKLRVERLLGGVNGFCGLERNHRKGASTPSWLVVGACHWPDGAVGDVEEGGGEARIQAILHKDSAHFEDAVRRIDFVLDRDGPKAVSEIERPGAGTKAKLDNK
jgi:hypothetical protein